MERYFATAMAVFSFSLSGGSQFGPMIAGFLIQARGWRWFFILCSILVAANLVSVLFLFPETNYRRIFYDEETANDADKQAAQMIEFQEERRRSGSTPTISSFTPQYAGSYWKDLVNFRDRGVDEKGLYGWPRQFSLPFRFILVPQVLFATISYGIFLAGSVLYYDIVFFEQGSISNIFQCGNGVNNIASALVSSSIPLHVISNWPFHSIILHRCSCSVPHCGAFDRLHFTHFGQEVSFRDSYP